MPPSIAALLFGAGIVGLNYLDRDRESRTSPAIWLAVIWVFIGASRMISQWLQPGSVLLTSEQVLEGSPLDRAILSALEAAALLVLAFRWRRTSRLLAEHRVVLLFFIYCVVSVVWSDFPLVAFKRWTKALGNFSMVLLILTDLHPIAAMKRLFARAGFLLVPISVLVIKYFPQYGRGYLHFSWEVFYSGASLDKNGLGALCLVCGLGSLWQFTEAYSDKQIPNRRGHLAAHGTILVTVVWLLYLAHSSTASSCLVLGSAAYLLTKRSGKVKTVHAFTAVLLIAGVFCTVFPDAYDSLVRSLGRAPDLTGRADIWRYALSIHINPLLGTGFETFWLGPRADYISSKFIFRVNQAHNGYLETYLNLGWIGVTLLAAQLMVGYRNIVRGVRQRVPSAAFLFALLLIATAYNMTEAAFKVMHPVWIAFLFAVTGAAAAAPRHNAENIPVPQGTVEAEADFLAEPIQQPFFA